MTRSARPVSYTLVDQRRSKSLPRRVVNRFGAKVISQTKAHLGFHIPEAVLVCIRRKKRKEVMFARKKAGFGKRLFRKPRVLTWLSRIACRR